MELYLIRKDQTSNSTFGILFDENKVNLGFIIEDGHRDVKVYGETRIPAGRYKLVRRYASKFLLEYKERWGHEYVWEIQGVPGFSDILIHVGNTPANTKGCLLPAYSIYHNRILNQYHSRESRNCYKDLYNHLNKEQFHFITIVDPC